ncbi:MAG: DUF1761 domain-containing protein [Aquisalinus sp.]|nr:DUF1761 domain-containing protein [Aquisalinus sp.]
MKVYGLPVWGILVGGVVYWFLGFIFYGVLFTDIWMKAEGVSLAEAEAAASAPGGALWMVGGFIISLAITKGVAFGLKWRGWPNLPGALGTAFILWAFFAVTMLGYDLVYVPRHDWAGFFVDIAYNYLGMSAAAVIITLMR